MEASAMPLADESPDWSLDELYGEARTLADRARRESDPERALERFGRALKLLDGVGANALTADLLRWIGTVHREMGASSVAEQHYARSLRVAEAADYAGGEGNALNCLAIVAQSRGQLEVAGGFYGRALRIARALGDHRLCGMIEQNLGVMSGVRGDLDGALVRYRDSLSAFEAAGDEEGMCWVLNNMGMLHATAGNPAEAERCLSRGLEIATRRGDPRMKSVLWLAFGGLRIREEAWEAAADALKMALELADARDDGMRRAEALHLLARIDRERGDFGPAIERLEQAQDLAVEMGDLFLMGEVARELGDARNKQGDPARASAHWERALAYFREVGAVLEAVTVEQRLAEHGLNAEAV